MTTTIETYIRRRDRVLCDPTICEANRRLFGDYLSFLETKLKRINGLPSLDAGCIKTLLAYVGRLANVNLWFCNRPEWRLDKARFRCFPDRRAGAAKNG